MTEIANNNANPTTPASARSESFEVPSLPSFNSPEFADRAGRHVNVLFKDVREATKAVKSAIARFNAVDNAAAKQNGYLDIRDVFIQFQNDLWTLRGLLYEVKASVLEVLVDTDKGRDSFNRLKEHLQKITSEVQSMQYGTLTAFAHDWDGNLIYSPTVQSLRSLYSDFSVNYRYFRELYLPCDRLVGSFKTKPFRVTYSLPQTVLKEGSSDLPQRIVSLGQTLEPIAIQLGKLYIDKAVGSEPVSVSKLREAQVDVLQNLDVFVGGPILEKEGPMPSLHESIQKEIERARSQRFCVAFCGMVKAGKSLFLNALTGKQLLPSDELPATAWPCRLLHDPKAKIPVLSINTKYFDDPLKELRRRKIAAAMESYQPPSSSDFLASLADDDDDDDYSNFDESDASSTLTSGQDDLNGALYHDWKDLHDYTKKNLKIFENESFRLPNAAQGDDDVVQLLGMVNDIVRLCRIFKIDIPEAKPDTWPRLTVEFESLRDKTIEGTFEFIDLPGVGEAHSDFHSFEDLVRIAAKEADTVVPIISFKEVAKGDWRKQLPQIVQTGLKRPPDFVLCTHMDQVQTKSRVTEQVHSVGKEFWPTITDFERRVLRCSTRLGIGAHLLITQSQQKKPKFENIWKENTILFDCVEKILGVGDSKSKYEELKREEWIEALEVQLKNSRLQDAMSQLTAGIVNSAQGLALQLEGRKLMLMMKKIASDQKRSLVEISRTRDEFEQAYKAFQQAQHKFKGFRGICEEESKKLRNSAELKLDRAFAILEQNGQKSAVLAVEDATKRVEHRAPKSGTLKSNEIVFSTKFEVEKFFYMAQDKMAQDAKNDLSREFVGFVRELADRSRLQLFELLVQKLESVTKEKQAPPELVDDILEQLNYQKQDVEVLFSATVKTKAVRTDVERHNVATAYTAIKDAMSKPFMHSSESVDLDDNASNITETTSSQTDSTAASELGFMIRAPIAVLATIPLLLGSLVWPWLVHRKKFVIDKDVLAKHFQEQIQKPFFAELKKEAQKTVDTVIGKSSELAQRIVNDSLKEEQARFEHENNLKNTSDEERAGLSTDVVSTFWNLSAAEKGLDELQGKFDEVLQKS